MYTFCPNCHAIFRLTTRHLAKAGGYTRCGECRLVYNAIDYLYEELAETREALDQSRLSSEDQAEAGAQEPLLMKELMQKSNKMKTVQFLIHRLYKKHSPLLV